MFRRVKLPKSSSECKSDAHSSRSTRVETEIESERIGSLIRLGLESRTQPVVGDSFNAGILGALNTNVELDKLRNGWFQYRQLLGSVAGSFAVTLLLLSLFGSSSTSSNTITASKRWSNSIAENPGHTTRIEAVDLIIYKDQLSETGQVPSNGQIDSPSLPSISPSSIDTPDPTGSISVGPKKPVRLPNNSRIRGA